MSNDIINIPVNYADRMYSLVPANYRAYDEEQGQPLRALLGLVGKQVGQLRQELDELWDNFFIETCDEWVVPYLAGLVGTNLLAHPVGQSNRLDVFHTVGWRQRQGTPLMLRTLAASITGWPTELAEFFRNLGWSQNVNHLRKDALLTVDLRDPLRLSRLGRWNDPWAHAADFRLRTTLDRLTEQLPDQPRIDRSSLGIGRAAWGTPGRFRIKNLGFFVRRLQTYFIQGASPAATVPGGKTPVHACYYTFDPLYHNTPLFTRSSREPISRAAFRADPSQFFGKDFAVRWRGVLLATDQPLNSQPNAVEPANFGFGTTDPVSLRATDGLEFMDFDAPGIHSFKITALGSGGELGHLTLQRQANSPPKFIPDAARVIDRLIVKVELDPQSLAQSVRFPGGVLAVRGKPRGVQRTTDGLYVYLPAALVSRSQPLLCQVAADGSTYSVGPLENATLLRPSEGQIFPPRAATASTTPVFAFGSVTDLVVADESRIQGVPLSFQVESLTLPATLITGTQPMALPDWGVLGALATFDRTGTKASTYAARKPVVVSNLESQFLRIRVQPRTGAFVPATELIVTNDRGQSLLVYLPEVERVDSEGVTVVVADDGSTYWAPETTEEMQKIVGTKSFAELPLARASVGQVLPMTGLWPLQHRRPVMVDLSRGKFPHSLESDELGIDPELGRFAFPPGAPMPGKPGLLTVDYCEAFGGDVGARTYEREVENPPETPTKRVASKIAQPPTFRYVLSNLAARSPASASQDRLIYSTVKEALEAVQDQAEVIEILDSATYPFEGPFHFDKPTVHSLVIQAARKQRPCLTFFIGENTPANASISVASRLSRLELNGLLISGGPLQIESKGAVTTLAILACTLDPRIIQPASLVVKTADSSRETTYSVCHSITGGLRINRSRSRLVVADSIVDQQHQLAIGGAAPDHPIDPHDPDLDRPAENVHLERVTVLGRVRCDILTASESLLDEIARVTDQQQGCIRYSRFEFADPLRLPRRYACHPEDAETHSCHQQKYRRARPLAPVFNSRQFGRPDYAQLAVGCPSQLLSASTEGSEIGAFTSLFNTIRLANLRSKLQEFLPVGLTASILCET